MEFAQNEEEFEWLLNRASHARSVLEIGSRFGESIYRFAKKIPPKAKFLCIDWPNADDNPLDSERALRIKRHEILAMGHDCDVIFGDSHDSNNIAIAQAYGPFDLVFIDGDHTERGVQQDWDNYGHLGKMVAFHDIAVPPPCYVSGLWIELRRKYYTDEYVAKDSFMGIGIVYREKNVTES